MSRWFLFASIVASSFVVVFGVVGAGCSSSGPSPATTDGAPIPVAIGEPCNPSLPNPCEALTDVCSVSVCDVTSRVCVRVAVDAGPICTGGNGMPPACTEDCDAGADGGADAEAGIGDAGEAGADAAADGTADAIAPDGTDDTGADATVDAPLEASNDDGGGD